MTRNARPATGTLVLNNNAYTGEGFMATTKKRKRAAAAVAAPAASSASTSTSGIRTIRNGAKIGRPKIHFTVGLAVGKTAVRKGSLRGKILQLLREKPEPHQATITALEEQFGEVKARAAVQKLLEAGWLKRITATA